MAGMVVKNNMSALNTLNVLNMNHSQLSKSLAKVSSGMRINGAADDASGYAISERMRVQIRGLEQDNRNTQNGNSLLKVAEGAVSSTVDILKTLKEKVINAANDTNTDEDRATIQKELDQSIDQINDNANVTYNGKYLVDGTKNSQGSATYTALTNKSLATDTVAGTALTNLKNRNGENLGILSTDTVTVSYVQNGKTYTSSFTVGTGTLHDIFVSAEAADITSQTFADLTNSSVSIASGVDSSNMTALRTQLWNDYQTKLQAWQATQGATGTVAVAESALNQAKNNLANYDTQVVTVSNKLGALTTEATNSSFLASGNSYLGTGWGNNFSTQYQNWTNSNSAGFGPAPTDVINSTSASSAYYRVWQVIDDTTFTDGANFRTAFSDYKSAYDTLSAMGSRSSLVSAVNSAQSAYDNAVADAANKKTIADTALGQYNATFGPKLLEGSNVGVDRAGNTVMTATRENAITVTANGEGIDGQIAGFTISVSDNQGNVKKSVNASLDEWGETVRAENESKNDNSIVLQTGTKANQSIKVALTDMRSEALGLKGSDGQTLNIGTQKKANAAISVLDNAIQKALDEQTKIGSIQSRLEYTAANLTTATENVQASESAIRDADMAKEMTEYTKNNVLLQTSQSMLAQANQSSSAVLGLLQ